MIKINCTGCTNHCCGKIPVLIPVLLPSEEERFKKYSTIVKTLYREIRILAKKKNNNCIFLDDKKISCTIYGKRPFECMIYPFLLDFSGKSASVKLDERFCSNLKTLQFDKQEIIALIKKYKFTKEWIKAYDSLENV